MPIFQQPYAFSITNNQKPIFLRTPTDGRLGNHVSYLLGYEIASPRMPLKSAYRLLHTKSGYATLSDDWMSAEELAANYENLGFEAQRSDNNVIRHEVYCCSCCFCNLPLNSRNSISVRKTCESYSIVNDFYHCSAVVVDQICNIESKFLGVGLKRFFPYTCTGL